MSVSPQGMSIQALYRYYRSGELIVNRQYQRKLVWHIAEKQKLIDSIFSDYPLPLFLFAEKKAENGEVILEVIDGIQRLNAIFGFIENSFLWNDRAFDINEFSRARQAAETNQFEPYPETTVKISAKECANFLDYQLAVTIFPGEKDDRITDVFGRINSGGRQLSDQERRQAGILSPFAELIRSLAAEIRGDVSKKSLALFEMPEISIETAKNIHGYSLKAEDIFWCFQGILRTGDLRDSEDERVLADICSSILNGGPVDSSGEYLDKIYSKDNDEYIEINRKLSLYDSNVLRAQIKEVVSAIKTDIEKFNSARFSFRDLVYPKHTTNSQKTPFYAVFMAYFELMMTEKLSPPEQSDFLKVLDNLTQRINTQRKAEERKKNIDAVCGMLRPYFVKAERLSIGQGQNLILDFENSIRRSKVESVRYEFKQGLLRLDKERKIDDGAIQKINEEICAIANVGNDDVGVVYIGIADKPSDVTRIQKLDSVSPINIPNTYDISLVGIDREAKHLNISIDQYFRKICDNISNSKMTESLKLSTLNSIDIINYKGLSIIRICIPPQNSISFIGEDCFFRKGSSTQKATGQQIALMSSRFK